MKKLIFFLFVTSSLMSQEKYIYAGKIYDSNSGKYLTNKTIIISKNISTLKNVVFVMKDGKVYKK